jgi:hypothetical protein
MTLQSRMTTVPVTPPRQSVSRSSRSMGIYLLAGRGTGKSRLLGRKIAMEDFLAGIPQCVIDPVGATIDNFLDTVLRFLQHFPTSQHPFILQRIRYVDMSGKGEFWDSFRETGHSLAPKISPLLPEGQGGVIVPFPLYYKLGSERSLLEIAERYLQVIIKSNPDLFSAQVLGWPPLHRIGVYTGMILSALGYQITEAEDLLRRPEQWDSRFREAEHRYLEAAPAVSFFRNEFIPMRPADRYRLTTLFLDKIFTFSLDPSLRAMFGAKEPGILWPDVVGGKQTILLDFRHEQDEEMRRFKMLWAFDYLYSWIKTRGRSENEPFGLIIDEFAHMTQKVLSGNNPLAQELDEFINVYMRQHTIWFTAAHQELYQIDEQLRNTLLSLGTYILGSTSSMQSARELADCLFFRDPWWVKYWRPVFARTLSWQIAVIAEEPEFMPLEEQTELFAQQIKKLGRFQFLFRPAVAEGHIGTAVMPLTIRHEDCDPETGEHQFPDTQLMARVRAVLASQSGIPMQTLLTEQESRLTRQEQRRIGSQPPHQAQEAQTATAASHHQPSADEVPTAHPPLPPRRHRITPPAG